MIDPVLRRLVGLIRHADWPKTIRWDEFPAGVPFAAYFTRHPPMPDGTPSGLCFFRVIDGSDMRIMTRLRSRFPSLAPTSQPHVWTIGLHDYGRMLLLYGGRGTPAARFA